VGKTLIYQPIDGYCYNSDTIFLADFIRRFKLKGEVLDIGSGSGVLGILLSKMFPEIALNSFEKQESFQFLTEKNCQVNGVETELHRGDFLQSSFSNRFDFIVSNPPFYSSSVIQSENESLNIARYQQHLPVKEFFRRVSKSLKPRGYFIFCYDSKQLQSLMNALSEAKLTVETVRFVHPKPEKDASLVMIQARKNSKSAMKTLPPLYNFSDEVSEIYKMVNTHTLKCKLD
jgi:tRNA1(Val) A37 N6-methylase TrmN6